jgi:hypothetical protein
MSPFIPEANKMEVCVVEKNPGQIVLHIGAEALSRPAGNFVFQSQCVIGNIKTTPSSSRVL